MIRGKPVSIYVLGREHVITLKMSVSGSYVYTRAVRLCFGRESGCCRRSKVQVTSHPKASPNRNQEAMIIVSCRNLTEEANPNPTLRQRLTLMLEVRPRPVSL